MHKDDAARELDKIIDTLTTAENHHRKRDEANAFLHLASQTRYSPLTTAIERALESAVTLRNTIYQEGAT